MTAERIKKIIERFRVSYGQFSKMTESAPSTVQGWVNSNQQPSDDKAALLEVLEKESLRVERERTERLKSTRPLSSIEKVRVAMALRSKVQGPILALLLESPMSVGELARKIGTTKQCISWYTKEMYKNDLIDRYRKEQWIVCELNPRIRRLVESAATNKGVRREQTV